MISLRTYAWISDTYWHNYIKSTGFYIFFYLDFAQTFHTIPKYFKLRSTWLFFKLIPRILECENYFYWGWYCDIGWRAVHRSLIFYWWFHSNILVFDQMLPYMKTSMTSLSDVKHFVCFKIWWGCRSGERWPKSSVSAKPHSIEACRLILRRGSFEFLKNNSKNNSRRGNAILRKAFHREGRWGLLLDNHAFKIATGKHYLQINISSDTE